jgi:hypothetical protein
LTKQRLARTDEVSGRRSIGAEHQDKACRPLGYVANPYRSCVPVLYLRGRGTVEVLFGIYNPREPRIIYAPAVRHEGVRLVTSW